METKLEDVLDHDVNPELGNEDLDIQERPAEEPKADAPEEKPKSDEGNVTVPLKALHAERDERQKLAAELEKIKGEVYKQPEPEPAPDPIADPEGYESFQAKQLESAVMTVEEKAFVRHLNASEYRASKAYGADTVEATKEWFQSQPPAVQEEIRNHPDPYDYAVEQHKKQETAEKMTPELMEKFEAFLKGEQQEPPKAPQTTAGERTVGARKGPEWAGPTPLEAVLNG